MDVLDEIASAIDGLLFLSETDAPFKLLLLQANESIENQLKAILKRDPGTKTEIVDLDYFLRNQVKTYEGATPESLRRADRFKQLLALLKLQLHHIKVFRFGDVAIDAAITGNTTDGRTIALITNLVET